MARPAFFVFAIAALLTLASCRTQRAAAPHDAPAPAPATVRSPAPATDQATVPPARAAQPTPAAVPAPAPAPAPAPPSAQPLPSSAPSPAPPSTAKPSTPKTSAAPKPAASPPVASEPKTQPAPAAPKAPSLDLNSLEQRLKDTRAIGVFTKLSLKNQVDDLLDELRAFHKGGAKTPPSELRQKYDLLIMKVLSLLQNGDPQLASAIASSRETLWGILMDPQKFANI
jgi:hypothetical protein